MDETASAQQDNIVIVPFEKLHVEEVRQLFQTVLIQDEPILGSRGVAADPSDRSGVCDMFVNAGLESGLSLVAIDTIVQKVVGFRLSERIQEPSKDLDVPPQQKPRRLSNAFEDGFSDNATEALRFMFNVASGNILEAIDNAKTAMNFIGLCVDANYRRQQVANRLIMASIGLAKKRGFDCISVLATTYKSQALFEKLGFEVIRQTNYATFEVNGMRFINVEDPRETCAKWLVLKLS